MEKNTMFKLTYGLFVLTTKHEGKDNGCIINTAIQAASEPNQMSICVNKANYTHDLIKESRKFNISVIAENASFDLFKRFGFQSGRDVNKFDLSGYGYAVASNGIRYVTAGTNAYFAVDVDKQIDLGSHTMFIGEIKDMQVLSEVASVTYNYYQENIKPAPKPSDEGRVGFRCKICGYEYEGEILPEDFICPTCKHPASDFEKM